MTRKHLPSGALSALAAPAIAFCLAACATAGIVLQDNFDDNDISDWQNRPIVKNVVDDLGRGSNPLPSVHDGRVWGYGLGYNYICPWMIREAAFDGGAGFEVVMEGKSGPTLMNQAGVWILSDQWHGDMAKAIGYRFAIYGEWNKWFEIGRYDGNKCTDTLLAQYPIGNAIHQEHSYTVTRDHLGNWSVKMDGTPLVPQYAYSDLTYSTFSHIGIHFNSQESELDALSIGTAGPGGGRPRKPSLLQRVKDFYDEHWAVFTGARLFLGACSIYSSVAGIVAAPATAGVSLAFLLGEALKAIATEVLFRIAEDPPDPQYAEPVRPVFPDLPINQLPLPVPPDVRDAWERSLEAQRDVVSYMVATLAGLEKYQGAVAAGSAVWADWHARQIDTWSKLLSERWLLVAEEEQRLLDLLRTRPFRRLEGYDPTMMWPITEADIENFRVLLASTGLPEEEKRLLGAYGFGPEMEQAIIDNLLSVPPSEIPRDMLRALELSVAADKKMATIFSAVPEPCSLFAVALSLLYVGSRTLARRRTPSASSMSRSRPSSG